MRNPEAVDALVRAEVLEEPAAPRLAPRSPEFRRWYLTAEFLVLFVGGPLVAYLRLLPIGLIPVLLLFTALAAALLLLDRSFDRRRLWDTTNFWPRVRWVSVRFVPLAAALGVAFALYEPARLFELVRAKPEIWLLVMALYPIFSVYPQELVYRAFMFHRYRPVFPSPKVMIVASAAAFGYMHIVFQNPIAVILTLIGGLIFAWTYERTRSLMVVWVEHALFGCFVFTIGLGFYFFGGSVRHHGGEAPAAAVGAAADYSAAAVLLAPEEAEEAVSEGGVGGLVVDRGAQITSAPTDEGG